MAQIFTDPPQVAVIPTWDAVEGPGSAGLHPPDKQQDPIAAQEALQQLVELGYIAPPAADVQETIEATILDQRVNMATSYMDAGLLPSRCRCCRASRRRNPKARHISLISPKPTWPARPGGGAPDVGPNLATNAQAPETVPLPRLDMFLGILAAAEGNDEESLQHLRKAETAEPRLPCLHNQIGNIYLRARRWSDAARAFRRALEIDGDYAPSCHGLSVALLREDRAPEAAELALRAVGLQHHYPAAHFQLGAVLARLGWPERAVQAFETGLSMRPGVLVVHRYLARLYGRLGQDEKARWHRSASTRAPLAAATRSR